MRAFPLMIAALVAGLLYLGIVERDRLVQFAAKPSLAALVRDPPAAEGAAPPPAAVPPPPAEAAEGREVRPLRVTAMHSHAQSIDNGVLVRGVTAAVRRVDVRSETSALVISEPRQAGSAVAAGDVLCALAPGTREATLAEVRARLADARITYRAADQLSQEGFGSEMRRVAAQAGLESARAAVAAAEREIERLTIRAPFDGNLETDSAELGTLLQPGALCATVIRLDPILLVGFVAETEVDKIGIGAMARARLVSGREVAGAVTFVSRAADPQTRTFRVEVTVPNPDLAIRDGQTAEIAIAAQGISAHLLPASALTLNDGGALGVRVVAEGDTARFVPVQMLRDTAEGVWVAGLPDEALVIVVGQEYIVDGVPVVATEVGASL